MTSDVRLDVWLWAARFYKTRTLCKTAIEAGQVRVDGETVKPAKSVSIGMRIRVKQGTTLRRDPRKPGSPRAGGRIPPGRRWHGEPRQAQQEVSPRGHPVQEVAGLRGLTDRQRFRSRSAPGRL